MARLMADWERDELQALVADEGLFDDCEYPDDRCRYCGRLDDCGCDGFDGNDEPDAAWWAVRPTILSIRRTGDRARRHSRRLRERERRSVACTQRWLDACWF